MNRLLSATENVIRQYWWNLCHSTLVWNLCHLKWFWWKWTHFRDLESCWECETQSKCRGCWSIKPCRKCGNSMFRREADTFVCLACNYRFTELGSILHEGWVEE